MLAPCDRSAIWLAKSLATLAFLAAAEVVALPLFALFFHGLRWSTVAGVALADVGICTVGTFVGATAVVTRARELLLPLLFLPLAIPLIIGGVGASVVGGPGRYLGFLALYDLLFALLCWAAFEYVVGRVGTIDLRAPDSLARARGGFRSCSSRSRSSLVFFVAPNDADQGFSQRIFYFHVSIAFTAVPLLRRRRAGRRCATSGSATRAPTSRATSRSTRA